jgi:hypothetical protein
VNKPHTPTPAWTRRLTAIATGLALVLISGSAALADHAWGPYHWERGSNPIQLQIGNNLTAYGSYPSADNSHFNTAFDDWDSSSVLSLTEVDGAGLKNCGAVNGRVEVCNDAYGFRRGGWLGVATIWADGDHIVKSAVKLNDTFLGNGGAYGSPAWRQLVMCQEIGHAFGLDHQDENFNNANLDTCMDYTNSPASNQHPNQHDYDMLADLPGPEEAIYEHLDGFSGGGDGGGGGNCPPRNPKCTNGALKAPPFSEASRANGSVYVDQMRNGLTRIKHVFWVPRR